MKKIFTFITISMLLFTLIGCSPDGSSNKILREIPVLLKRLDFSDFSK